MTADICSCVTWTGYVSTFQKQQFATSSSKVHVDETHNEVIVNSAVENVKTWSQATV